MCSEIFSKVRNGVVVLGLAITLSACGGGGGGSVGDALTDTSNSSVGSVPVSGGPVGTASLNWSPPVDRADGQPLSLSEIQGYRIYYGTQSGDYLYSIYVGRGTAYAWTITDLPVGTYYFALTTVDVNGQESGYSAEAVKIVS